MYTYNEYRILALNDDNHETSFHHEWRITPFHNHMEFIKYLAEPHNCTFNIKCVYLLDIDEDDEEMCDAFDKVQCAREGHEGYYQAFDKLWEIGKETMFGC